VSGSEHSAVPPGVVVIGASFGGLGPICAVLAALPEAFPLPVVVVLHRPATSPDVPDALAEILRRRCRLAVDAVGNGYRLAPGRVALVPGGHAAGLAPDGTVTIAGAQPARLTADALLCDAATVIGKGVIAVVLTGKLTDGAAGVRAVKHAGGMVLVQDPAECAAPGMPTAALSTGCVDHRLPVAVIGAALVALAMAPGAADLLRVPVAAWAASA
jgi:two-component system chemotaxis response regulator CheB